MERVRCRINNTALCSPAQADLFLKAATREKRRSWLLWVVITILSSSNKNIRVYRENCPFQYVRRRFTLLNFFRQRAQENSLERSSGREAIKRFFLAAAIIQFFVMEFWKVTQPSMIKDYATISARQQPPPHRVPVCIHITIIHSHGIFRSLCSLSKLML